MMHDEEAASPRWKLNPKNFASNKKSVKFCTVCCTTCCCPTSRSGGVCGWLGKQRRWCDVI